jgi:hypothetical protein
MRTTSTLLGLTLLALASPARAEKPAPAPAEPAAASDSATAAAAPAAAKPAEPQASASAATPAADAVATSAPEPAEPGTTQRKWQLGLAFLPMAMGTYTYSDTLSTLVSGEAYFGYGLGLSVGRKVWRGLVVGLSPQAIFNVQPKPRQDMNLQAASSNEIDILVRLAYELPLVDTISIYAEVLPGFSLIMPSDDKAVSKGLVLAFDVGALMDLTDRFFINVSGGYQKGFQNQTQGNNLWQLRTTYVRGSLGAGYRF